MRGALVVVLIAACGAPSSTSKAPAREACLADEVPASLRFSIPDFGCEERGSCEKDCAANDASGCFSRAIDLQRADDDKGAIHYFDKTCRLGNSIGCTNVGATAWTKGPAFGITRACIHRLFEVACKARDPWGCGMFGRDLSERATTDADRAAARAHFDRACNDLGNVTCRMFALHLEKGQLGTWSPDLSKALMLRACETGDDEACDAPSADSTFE